MAHRWKQLMLFTQLKSPRHVSVSLQQAPTMHWLHGVPPGSSEHMPASTGSTPQCPPVQTSPTQHWFEFWQFDPGGRHAPPPHVPLSQTVLQHSSGVLHGKPSSVHWPPPPQMPLSQNCPQH